MSQAEQRTVAAAVLAGGSPTDPVAVAAGVRVKSLAPLLGRSLLAYTVRALADAGLTPIAVGTRADAVDEAQAVVDDAAPPGTALVVAPAHGGRFTDTLKAALGPLAPDKPALVATGDLPLLTPEAVADFLAQATATGADLVYSTVRMASFTGAYRDAPRTRIKLRDGVVTGGNVALSSPQVLLAILHRIEQAFTSRKSPVSLARLFGLRFILRLLTGRLDMPSILSRAEAILGCSVGVVISEYPEIGFDVDKTAHLEVAERVLRERGVA
jgi:GTP:adenosylcobinamide-phosphate guanylyltransferase